MLSLIEGDIFDTLPGMPKAQCLIADPPDAIGLRYKSGKDQMCEAKYRLFLYNCICLFTTHANIVWISYNAKWTFLMGDLVQSFLTYSPAWEVKPFVQTFTFGQNNTHDCGNGHRPIVRFRHKDASLYAENIKVPSWRELHGDKRAAPGGRVPLDVWFEFPRVTGNSRQRRPYHPTQLHEGLVARMMLLSTKEGDMVYDAFSGTGTVLRVGKRAKRNVVAFESDSFYCNKLREEHPEIKDLVNV